MPLFHPRIIEKHTKAPAALPVTHADILSNWAESLSKGAFNRETSHDGEFIQRILIDVLGYTGSSAGAKWTLGKNQPVGSGNVDVALGHFSADSVQIVAPFELKGAKTRDLDAIMPGRNKSPVQQAWEYAMDAKGAKWVLVSNYREIRLYAVGYGRKDYEKFGLSQLTNPAQYARFMLLLSAESLLGSRTQALLKESENKDKEITDKLYLDYKTLRARMIDTLTKDNPSVPVLEIIQYTQTILDRILFVAFAEDRGLLPDDTLKSCYEDRGKWSPQPAWENFKGLFYSIDKGNPPLKIPGYNGGLFAQNDALNNLNVSDALCEGFKTIGSYDFDSDVSVNILGHIFEQSITDLEEIKASLSSDDTSFDKKKSKRKKDGIFYTPPYITRYIVEQAVGGWLNDRKKEIGFDKLPVLEDEDYASIQAITRGARKGAVTYNAKIEKHIKAWEAYKKALSNIKVLDPACGSGAFLNEVFDYLYREGQVVNSELATLNAGQEQLFRWDTHILANNIYGVDINQESVEITKLSLWLKTANRNEKLTYLDDNIKCGNSLIDDPAIAGNLAFKWEKEFADIMSAGGFDVVVGNPPYGIDILENEKEFFKKNYPNSNYKINLYSLFIERAFQIFRTAVVHFIVPKSLLFNSYYKNMRELLIKESNLEEVFTLKEKVFADAEVGDSLLLKISLPKKKNQKTRLIAKINFNDSDGIYLVEKASYFLSNQNSEISIISDSSKDIVDRIRHFPKVGDLYNLKNGLNPGNVKHKLITSKKLNNNCKWIVWGKDIARYQICWSGDYINYDEDYVSGFTVDDIKSKDGMNKQNKIDFALRSPDIFECNKVLIRKTGDKLIAALDDTENFYFDTLVHGLYPKHSDHSLGYLLAILNSKFATHLYRLMYDISGKAFAKVSLDNLSNFYIPKGDKHSRDLLHKHTFVMLAKNKELHDVSSKFLALLKSEFGLDKLGGKLEQWYTLDFAAFVAELTKKKIPLKLAQKAEWMEHFEKQKITAAALKSTIDTTDREIDQMVYTLYGLTPDEIAIIENAA